MEKNSQKNNSIKAIVKDNPLVTIAIPFFNIERYLGFAIRSVINQTYNNWELLLIDDNGTDSSLKIAEDYAKRDNRIRVISDGCNKGLAVRLNETIEIATGELYARMDGDDIMAVDRIERQVECLLGNPNLNVVGCSAMIIDDNNRIFRSADMSKTKGAFIHPTVMGRTKWFKEYMYNPSFRRSQDVELWLRSNVITSSYNLQEPLLFYREFGMQTLKKNMDSHKALRKIYSNYKSYNKSFVWYIKGMSYTYIQDLVYVIFDSIDKIDFLMQKRKREPLPKGLWLTDDDMMKAIKN